MSTPDCAQARDLKVCAAVSWARCGIIIVPLRERDKKPIRRGGVDAGLIEPRRSDLSSGDGPTRTMAWRPVFPEEFSFSTSTARWVKRACVPS